MRKKPTVKAIKDSVRRSKQRKLQSLVNDIRLLLLPLQLEQLSRMRARGYDAS